VAAAKLVSPAGPGRASTAQQAAELDYAVDFETNVFMTDGTSSRFIGNLSLTLSENTPNEGNLVLSGKVRDISIVVDEGDDATRKAVERGLSKDLERNFALVIDPAGKLVQLGTPSTLAPGTESLLRAVLSCLQFSAGPGGGAKTWQSVEADHYGSFRADYRARSFDEVEKVKTYTELSLSSALSLPEAAGKANAKGRATFTLASSGRWPARVEATDELDLGMVRIHQRFTLTLDGQRVISRVGADLSRFRLAKLDTVTAQRGTGGDGKELARQLAGGMGFADALAELSRFADTDEDAAGRHAAMRRLIAVFDSDPRAVAEAASLLRAGSAGKDAPALLGALASSDAGEARAALNGMAGDRSLPAQLRNDVLNNMNVQPRATAETFATLTSLSNEQDPQLRKSAIMALGSTVRSTEGDATMSRDAERSSRTLQQGFQGAQTPDERALFLKALGNSGSSDALQAAKIALADPDPAVRRDGVRALRFVPGQEADQLIARAWLNDADEDVREAGPFAASYRPLSAGLAQAALTSLAQDAVESVRLRSLAFVAENRAENPTFSAALSTAAERDPSEEVRKNARHYLGNI
jgi:hypothetical protein